MSKLLKILIIIGFIILLALIATTAVWIYYTKDVVLQENKLINYSQAVCILDDNGQQITNASLNAHKNSVQICNLPKHVTQAFIASEDKSFYQHHGINYKRMLKATYKNIISRSYKEGASTISQQLIKNTHLNSEKTVKRKLQELKLTKQLEKHYTKNKILEMYLNTIYFGHNCYGLQNAANFYFHTNAENLTVEQAATLVGILTSPNKLSPFVNESRCKQKRNQVLTAMKNCNFLTDFDYKNAINSPISATKKETETNNNDYIYGVFEELQRLNLDYYRIAGGKIYTYLDQKTQNCIENMHFNSDYSILLRKTDSPAVCAYRSNIKNCKRQPGSTIKPICVYAPALEEKLIIPASKIIDEPINYGGYQPQNHDKKTRGSVTITQSVAQSLNIPAVKILNTLTISKAEKYANMQNISLLNEDKNLSFALGGMTHGVTLNQLCDSYAVFCNDGNFNEAKFIQKIIDKNGKILYESKNTQRKVFSPSTCSLMNEMLLQTAQNGTARKLKDLPYQVAAKTGTCGNEKGNTDAYTIAYTANHVLGVWLGSANNKPIDVSAGKDCCKTIKNILQSLYQNKTPLNLDTKTGTVNIEIDKTEYEKTGNIVYADDLSPKKEKLKIKCPESNLPNKQSNKFSNPIIETPNVFVKNNKVFIQLCQIEYYDYIIKRKNKGNIETIYQGNWKNLIIDEPTNGNYVYSITPIYNYQNKQYLGKTIELPKIYIGNFTQSPQTVPDILQKDWLND